MTRSLLQRLFGRPEPADPAAGRLYRTIVAQARAPGFYRACGVPDSLDGRFELLVLHTVLVVRRLRGAGAVGQALAQSLFDALIADLEINLREMGVGDMGVPPRLKRMAQAYYGRAQAYESALAGEGRLDAALARNLFGTVAAPAARLQVMAEYVRAQDARLKAAATTGLLEGRLAFDLPPEAVLS